MAVKLITIKDLVTGYYKNTPKVNWEINKVVDAQGNTLPETDEILVVIKCGDDYERKK